MSVVVVARHGERTDYVHRDQGLNWVQEQRRSLGQPWNPPLTPHGKQQATRLGLHLAKELDRLSLPPVSQVYASPLLRCLQTAACTGLVEKIGIEPGLMESINGPWYRSWALEESDGTWGGGPAEFDAKSVHELAQSPIQELLQAAMTSATPEPLPSSVDRTYSARTKISEPYSFPNHRESTKSQRQRMKSALETLASTALGNAPTTTLLVSHGGPVTHLYAELTGQSWKVHGESSYCCYSIYVNNDVFENVASGWEPIQVNESSYLNEKVLRTDAYM